VYEYISRGLFKNDRLSFAMHLTHGMYPDMFGENEWEVFTGLIVAADAGEGGGVYLDPILRLLNLQLQCHRC
jgi:dynein heavy chain 2